MFGPPFFVIFVVPALVAVAIAALAVRYGRRRARGLSFDETAYPGLARLRTMSLRLRYLGLFAGLAGGAVLAFVPWANYRLSFVAPIVTGIVAIVGIVLGERAAYGAARTPGVAGLERRSLVDYLSRRQSAWTVGALALLAVVIGFTTLAASPDDMGRAGRALTTSCTQIWFNNGVSEVVPITQSSSPFPGSWYSVPLVIGIVALVAACAVALRSVARRPRNGSDAELVRVDDALRRITAEGVVAATGLAATGALAFVAGLAYIQFGKASCAPVNVAASYALALVTLASLALVLRFLITVVVPGNGARR